MGSFKWLLEPIQVGPMTLPNRMTRSPMHSSLCGVNGEVSQQLIDMYENSAKNMLGLMVIEATCVDGRHTSHTELRIDDDRFEPGLRRLVEVVHDNGVPIVVQLRHYGMWGKDPVSPSGVACYGYARKKCVQPRAMSLAEAEEARDLFVSAAARAKRVGFDGVAIHGATSYLLQQWVSPHTNKRVDRYGGSFENRIALPLEIVRGIREACGPSFAVGYTLVADELLPDGITLEESLAFAQALEREGVHWVDARIGSYETIYSDPGGGSCYRQAAGLFHLSKAYKEVVSMPIFANCRGDHDVNRWEEAIAEGQCDAIQIGRPLIADPELPKKLARGKVDDIRGCIKCVYCNETGTGRDWQVSCAINAEFGRERDYAIRRAETRKRVLVVGGGPAGLEAARVAALRGHKVTLMEKQAQLGGNVSIGSNAPGKEIFRANLIDWLERQCKKAGVEIEINREATADAVSQADPDIVIVATGATPLVPSIPGVHQKHVVTAADVLSGKATVAGKVIIAGGGEVGVETADFITDKGIADSVTIVEMLPQIGSDMYAPNKAYLVNVVLPQAGVKVITGTRIDEIADNGVVASDKDWRKHRLEADTVVLAMGYEPDGRLFQDLKRKGLEVYAVGDCVRPRQIPDAIREAAYIARQI